MRSERQALDNLLDRLVRHANGHWRGHEYEEGIEYAINEIREFIADVQPEPAPASGTIDRDALVQMLSTAAHSGLDTYYEWFADRVLALVRPVEGIVLTREEAVAVARLAREQGKRSLWAYGAKEPDLLRALAERLEAAS